MNAPTNKMSTVSPVVAMRRAGAEFVVAVEPADPAHPPQTFLDKRKAWGAAGGLRLVLGLQKVDLTGDET